MAKIKNFLITAQEKIRRNLSNELATSKLTPDEQQALLKRFDSTWEAMLLDPRATVMELNEQLQCGFPPAGVGLISDNTKELLAFKKACRWALEAHKGETND